MSTGAILALILAAGAFFLIVLYNRLVALRQERKNAFADIDAQLRLRYDLVPNLVETVKGYAGHERQTLENVTEARSRAMNAGDIDARVAAEQQFGRALMQLFAVAENYPELRASENFTRLQAELSDIENKIAAARRFFNNATGEYNTAIAQFPANLIAGPLGFREEAFFDLPEGERARIAEPPKVSFSPPQP